MEVAAEAALGLAATTAAPLLAVCFDCHLKAEAEDRDDAARARAWARDLCGTVGGVSLRGCMWPAGERAGSASEDLTGKGPVKLTGPGFALSRWAS